MKKKSGVDSLSVDGVHITDEQLIADKFNIHFHALDKLLRMNFRMQHKTLEIFLPQPEPNNLILNSLQPFQIV